MATGSGKTTVMAMLIAWQTVNAARKDSKDFSRAFLIVTPGITIKDRLRLLQPSDENNYYETRELVPPEMLPEIRRAEIVITNYHAFQHRETLALPKVARSFLQGNDPEPPRTTETDAEMLERACGKLLHYDRVNVLNDEAHHCYRHKVGGDAEGALTGDDKREAADVADAADEAELDDIYETERRLLYVACTRAREHLLLTGVTPTSEYLADFTS
jgi:type III restriction enzyme